MLLTAVHTVKFPMYPEKNESNAFFSAPPCSRAFESAWLYRVRVQKQAKGVALWFGMIE